MLKTTYSNQTTNINTFYDDTSFQSLSNHDQQAYLAYLRHELASKSKQVNRLPTNSTGVGQYMADKYSDLDHEEFYLIPINNTNQILNEFCVAKGGQDNASWDIKVICRYLLQVKAINFFLVHNHPSGNLMPSEPDLKTNYAINQAANLLNITLLDHFIIGNGQYFSCAEHGLMSKKG